MHRWGDPGVDWDGIDKASRYIARYISLYGRVSVQDYKEKWGTVRVYCTFGVYEVLGSLVHPASGRVLPRWLRGIDWFLSDTLRLYVPVNILLVPYQEYIYRRAYSKAIHKWTHLRREILEGADYPELLIGL